MTQKLAFIAGETAEAQDAQAALVARYGGVEAADADVIVALGGDGKTLETLRRFMNSGKRVFGMNCGSTGFLLNDFGTEDLEARIAAAQVSELHPLKMVATDASGKTHEAAAINEVSMLRETSQVAKIEIRVDDKPRMPELVCDGLLLATPAGSTAYNLSAHGPILPIGASLLALTPISPFRPRRWRGALLRDTAVVKCTMLEADKRPVSVCADHVEFRDIHHVMISQDFDSRMLLLYDGARSLEERVLNEQFMS